MLSAVPVRHLATLVLITSTLALAQAEPELSRPPIVPAEQPTYAQRCFGVPGQVWIPIGSGRFSNVNPAVNSAPLSSFHAAQPVGGPGPVATAPPPPSRGGGSLGGGDPRALLVLAVVVVAALPIILYAVDSEAPAVVEQRFHCPSFGFDAFGGVDLGDRVGTAGSGSGRFTFGVGYFGTDFQFDLSAGSISGWSGHLLLRIGPKNHIEPNLAFGYRSLTLGGSTRNGLEVGVPHRYVLWREGLRSFSVELRPMVMFGLGSFDVGLEAALIIPIVEPIHLRAGGKLQSFGPDVIGGFNAGLSFSL